MDTDQQASPRVALTQEEMRILLQCNRDAFWQRSLPFIIAFGGSTHMLVKMGYLRPHATRGSLFKVIGAGVFGWFLGKVSFRGECQRRIMEQLPNSRLAETIRNRSGPGPHQNYRPIQPGGPIVVPPPPREDVDFGPPRYDENQQSQTAFSTGQVPRDLGPEGRNVGGSNQQSGVTYDELRRRHHMEAYQQYQNQNNASNQPVPAPAPSQRRMPEQQPYNQDAPLTDETVRPRGKRMTKYGDILEE